MEYRQVINYHIGEAKKKMIFSKKESDKLYWKWIINQLIMDYRGYERQMTWRRTPVMDLEDLFKRFFEGM